jgi:hypothetical protein
MARKRLQDWQKEAASLGIKLQGNETIGQIRELIEAVKAPDDDDTFEFAVPEEEAIQEEAELELEAVVPPTEPEEEPQPEEEPEMIECKGLFRFFPNTPEFFPCPGHPYSRAYYEWKGQKPPCERE